MQTHKVRNMREGTLRAQVRDVLKSGATRQDVERVVEKFDRKRKVKPFNVAARARGAVYLLQHHIGYGVREQTDGTLKLVDTKRKPAKRVTKARAKANAVTH